MTTPLEAIKVALEALELFAKAVTELEEINEGHVHDSFKPRTCTTVADYRRARAAHALLSQVKTAATIPDGWQLVPKEPTPEMLNKGAFYHIQGAGGVTSADINLARASWRAMLSASPQSPAQVPSKSEREAALEVASHVFDMIEPYLSATVSFGEVREVIIKAALASLPPKPDKEPS